MMKGQALSADVLLKPPTGIVNSIIHRAKFLTLIYGVGRVKMTLKDEEVMELGDAVIKDLRANYGVQSIGVHGKRWISISECAFVFDPVRLIP
jgi:hypothetical protein